MKYCPYCGAGFSDGTVSFCSDCGKKLPEPKEEAAKKASPQKVTTKKSKPMKAKKEKRKKEPKKKN